ncbi:MAG: periplasmic heavy metal sensor [Candidatus Deferrimicrobiaceae bacterium]
MRTRFIRIALVVSLAFNVSALVAAGVLYHRESGYWVAPFGMKVPRGRFPFEELSLRSGQMKILRENATRFHEEVDEKRREIAGKRNDLLLLLRADPPDTRAVHAVLDEMSRIQAEMGRKVAAHILQQKAVLDRPQQDAFFDLIQKAVMQRSSEMGPAACN